MAHQPAFDRHPLRPVYERTALAMPPKNAREIMQATLRKAAGEKVTVPAPRYLSAQNRRVRFEADLSLAQPSVAGTATRQQRRAIQRPWKQRRV